MKNNLIKFGWFVSYSGFQLPWKVDCDALTDEDLNSLARLISWKFAFSDVYGIPNGGTRLMKDLKPYAVDKDYPVLIVDDVLTTGKSMTQARRFIGDHSFGVVIFNRGVCPDWVWPIFTVNEWSQSRATGLG